MEYTHEGPPTPEPERRRSARGEEWVRGHLEIHWHGGGYEP